MKTKTYFVKFRGTSSVYTVKANSLQEAFIKVGKKFNCLPSSHMQQVFRCNYQDMQSGIIE